MVDIKLFNEWDTSEVVVSDISMKKYISLKPRIVPHSHGLGAANKKKQEINLVERLANKLMRSGQGSSKLSGKYIRSRDNCGKKLLAMKIIRNSLRIIAEKEKNNPVQVLVRAVENSALREGTSRIRRGGVTVPIAVDVAPLRRVDESLKNISLGTLTRSFTYPCSTFEKA